MKFQIICLIMCTTFMYTHNAIASDRYKKKRHPVTQKRDSVVPQPEPPRENLLALAVPATVAEIYKTLNAFKEEQTTAMNRLHEKIDRMNNKIDKMQNEQLLQALLRTEQLVTFFQWLQEQQTKNGHS